MMWLNLEKLAKTNQECPLLSPRLRVETTFPMMKLSLVFTMLLAKLSMAVPSSDANPNLPEGIAKNYIPSSINTNTLKFPQMKYRDESSSSETLISIDGVVMPLMPDAGWYTVTYGGQYTYADQIFAVYNKQTAIIELTACFCPGDQFQVFDNGVPITLTDAHCDANSLTVHDCSSVREEDPNVCADNNVSFCAGAAILEPGFHNVTVGVLASPWGAGAAFIRVDTACKDAAPDFYDLPLVRCCTSSNTCPTGVVE